MSSTSPESTANVSSVLQSNRKQCFFFLVTYIKHQDKDCLSGNNIQAMNLKTALDFDNCKKLCNSNTNCGGILVYKDACYLKGESCKNNLFHQGDRFILIKYQA